MSLAFLSRLRLCGTAGLVAGVIVASAASATEDPKLDLSATTCGDLIASNGAARKFFVFWFDGYLAAKRGTTVFDADKTQKRLDSVLKACEANVGQAVMPLMEKSK